MIIQRLYAQPAIFLHFLFGEKLQNCIGADMDIGEAIAVGDASLLPSRIIIDVLRQKPNSATVKFWDEWSRETVPDDIGAAVQAMRKQGR